MAEIDKPLPNTKTTVEVPGEVEIQEAIKENVEEIQTDGGPVEIEMTEEGGAEVSFDPKAASPEGGEDHFENLGEFLDDSVLDPLASELMEKYTNYKESRQEWADSYREGLNLLGFKYTTRTEPFSFKDTISDIGEYIKSGGIIGAGIKGIKNLFSRNTKNYVTTPQVKARDRVEAEIKAREEAARQEVERQAAYAQARQDRETYKDLEASITSGQGGQGFDRPSSGPTATGAGMGAGGGYASDYGFLKNGGRVGYKDGGLATLLNRRR